MRRIILTGVICTLAVTAAPAGAQAAARVGNVPFQRDRQPPNRAELEQRIQQRLAFVVQQQLGLNDDQTRRLSEVNQKYEAKRMDLVRRERAARLSMRRELMSRETPNEERVGQLLVEVSRIQRERLDLIDAEQNDLSRFLSATQRARYLGLQEQMRRRIEQFRERPPFMDESGVPGGRDGRRGRRPPQPPG
jgi:hypothetical protein